MYALDFEGELYDVGTLLGLLKATVSAALQWPEMERDLRPWLRE